MALVQDFRTRATLIGLLVVFLLINAVVLAMLYVSAHGAPPDAAGSGDGMAFGIRLLILLVVAAVSWFAARFLYQMLVRAFVPPGTAVNPALALVLYVVLIGAGYLFAFGPWILIFLAAFVVAVTLFTLTGLIGAVPVVVALSVAVCGGVLTWLLFA